MTEEQRAIIQELKKRKLPPEKLAIITELERRDSQSKPSVLDRAVDISKKVTAPMDKFGEMTGKLVGAASENVNHNLDPMSVIGKGVIAGAGKVLGAFDEAGQNAAETLAGPGVVRNDVRDQSLLQRSLGAVLPQSPVRPARPGEQGMRTSPEVAAAIGTGVQMIPQAVAGGQAIAGRKALAEGVSAVGRKVAQKVTDAKDIAVPAAKAFIPGAKRKVGEAIGAADKAAGIEQRIPTVSNTAKRLNLPARERGFADIVNSVKKTLDDGGEISPQDLSDFRDLVKQQYGANKIAKGTRMDALTAQTNDAAGKLLNKLVPKRSKLAKDYAVMSNIHKGLKRLAVATGVGAGAAGGLGIAGAILRRIAKG